MKYAIRSYGCQMNFAEAEEIRQYLQSVGAKETDNYQLADWLFVLTCTVRQHAEDRAWGFLKSLRSWKQEKNNRCLVVGGCLVSQSAHLIKSRLPYIDILVPASENIVWADRLKKILLNSSPICPPPLKSTHQSVIISYGCSNFCSYCIVPFVRGPERCRPAGEILSQIQKLLQSGVKKITLLGQNVNSYFDNSLDFADLLKKIDNLSGDFTFTFLTSHPRDMNEKIISTLAGLKKWSGELHLPLQSGSDRILKLMNRGYTYQQYCSIVRAIRRQRPDICLSTDLIVGFPGETEEDFCQTKKAISELNFQHFYAFKYSPRPPARSASLTDDVPDKIKEERLAEVLQSQRPGQQ